MLPALEPNLDVERLFQALLPMAFVVMIAGLVGAVARAASPSDHLHTVVRLIVVVAVLSQFDSILDSAQNYVEVLVRDELQARPDEVANKYLDFISQSRGDTKTRGFWDRLFSPHVNLVEAIMAALLWLAALVAGCVLFLAYLFQKLVLQAGYGFAPLFFSFLTVSSIRSIGVQFLLSMTGVLLWPLGWAVASLLTDQLIEFATDQSFFVASAPAGGLAYAFRNLLAGLLISIWVMASTLIAPLVIQRVIATGAQVGTGFGGVFLESIRR